MFLKDKGICKALWAGMFLLCLFLGFVPQPTGFNRWLLVSFGVLFFLPPGLLLAQCRKDRDRKTLKLIIKLSGISLGATVVLLVANILSLLASQAVGDALYYLLIVVSSPMICCQYWWISLSGWAILLWCALVFLRDLRK